MPCSSQSEIIRTVRGRIEPTRKDVDEWIWVIVGDLSPAYITCEESPNPVTTLDACIGAMQEWGEAAEQGAPTDHLIPVNVEPLKEIASRVEDATEISG